MSKKPPIRLVKTDVSRNMTRYIDTLVHFGLPNPAYNEVSALGQKIQGFDLIAIRYKQDMGFTDSQIDNCHAECMDIMKKHRKQ